MIYNRLADMDFAKMLFEAKAQTQSGVQLLNNYQAHVMANPVTCAIINNFIKEAKSCLYDNGIQSVYKQVTDFIAEAQYSWLLASTCESIQNNSSSYNYLHRNAANQVEKLLEMKEDDVVRYIKAGALKNVMFVEGFRNIVKSIQNDMPIVESRVDYTNVHPISVTEKVENDVYFTVLGHLYKIDENKHTELAENDWNKVSNNFRVIAQLLESNVVKFENETATFNCGNHFIYTITEQGKCTKTYGDNKKLELTVEQLREQNALYINTIPYAAQKQQLAQVLEGVAKICEQFDSIAVLNNIHIISTANDRVLLIENENNTASATLIATNHSQKWSVTDNIYEVCNFVKKQTRADISESFKEKIEETISKVEQEEKQKIEESIKQDEIKARKEKIEQLTEKYKNDPTRLAVLSKIAQELSELEK